MQLTDVSSALAQQVVSVPYSSGVPFYVRSCLALRIAFTATTRKQFLNTIKFDERKFTVGIQYNNINISNSFFVGRGKLKLTRFISKDFDRQLKKECGSKVVATIYQLNMFAPFVFHSSHNQHQAVRSCWSLSIAPLLQGWLLYCGSN